MASTSIPLRLELGWHNRRPNSTPDAPLPRLHTLRSAAGVITAGSRVEGQSEALGWPAQELLLAAVAQAHFLAYLQAAEDAGIALTQYKDEPVADFSTTPAQIRLTPKVWLVDTSQRDAADQLHQQAAANNSLTELLRCDVDISPMCPPDQRPLPEFTSRLGAPLAILKPKSSLPPSQVSGRGGPAAASPGNTSAAQSGQPAGADTNQAATAQAPTGQAAAGQNAASGQPSFYEQIGGSPTFARLVDQFYAGVAADPVLRPMYPEEDLGPAKKRLQMFLEQYWGGPRTYSEQRGHPRLRMRHSPYRVDFDARDRWLKHMKAAVDSLDLPPLQHQVLWDYLERAAYSLVNTFSE